MPVVNRSIEREVNRLTRCRNRLSDFVLETKAAGLAGARLKLHPPAEGAAIRDILRVIAREMKARSC
jgi:hypothetical protein